jgi:16S rRNA (guanine527-N7)-methyltransferase
MKHKSIEMVENLKTVAAELGIGISEQQYCYFATYYEFLLEYNMKVNLTRIVEPLDVAAKHFGDSLALLNQPYFNSGSLVADIGTGAGFPGLPLAIMRPDIQVVLVDSLRKRTIFLLEITKLLGLNNIQIVWARAEEVGRNPLYRQKFDIVLARAVASLNILVELCVPLLKTDGTFLAMKGPKADEEILQAQVAIQKLGSEISSIVDTPLTLVGESRTLISIRKIRPTKPIYPRKAGTPERQPLV